MAFVEFIQTYWSLLTIPVVSSLVGFATNWLAVKMMMYPIEFRGFQGLGWQGVIPANAGKMAEIVVTHSLEKVMTQQELISRVDPTDFIREINYRIDPLVEDIVDEVMTETSNYGVNISNFFWSAAPLWVRGRVYREVRAKLPEVAEKVFIRILADTNEMLDLNQLIATRLGTNKKLLTEVFQKSAGKEFKFIQYSGFYFGFPLGIPVMFLWYFFPAWWLLPLFGLLVGYITNKLAMTMVQKPLQPTKYGPFTFQGLFLKRQQEVSRYYGKVFANKLVTAAVLTRDILNKQDNLKRIRQRVKKQVQRTMETTQGPFKPITVISMGPTQYARVIDMITDRAFKELIQPDKRTLNYLDRTFNIEATIAERLGKLPPKEFYQLLHPIIEEDEWKLIAVGAALGFLAGIWQWVLLT